MSLEKIKEIETEMARTQKNKATSNHLAILKAKLSKLRRSLLTPTTKSSAGVDTGFDVSKTGVARIGFIGFPSVGKSTLMSKLTNTFSEVADYEFTTLTAVPGILHYNSARIQILDLPGIIEGAKSGRGRGKQVLGMARSCNMLVIVLDATKPLHHKRIIEKELYEFGIRINKEKPSIKIHKRERGGINLIFKNFGEKDKISSELRDKEIVKNVCAEYRLTNAEIHIQKGDIDDLIDVLEGNRVYVPALNVLNKVDGITLPELDVLARLKHICPISAENSWGFENLLENIWNYLNLVRIYPKPKGRPVDEPVVLKYGKTKVKDFCLCIHKDLVKNFKVAVV